jgi:hypothetical protein
MEGRMAGGSCLVGGGMSARRVIVEVGVLGMLLGGCSGEGKSNGNGANGNVGMPGAGEGSGVDGATSTVEATRAGAVATTAETNADCIAVAPFYWEIGDAGGALISGSVGSTAPVASTVMAIASASKWLFGAYAVQRMGGMPAEMVVPFFNFTSGYAGLDSCTPSGTVDDCLSGAAGTQIAASIGKFDYDGAHLQKLASLMALGADDNTALATEVRSQIGSEIDLEYSEPQPATGVRTSADQYALFLRKLLVGSTTPLLIGPLLGSDTVCTNPMTCPTAVSSPITGTAGAIESWHYSLTHWVEDDPAVGDGAFSSGGAFGFYPWVDATRTSYGVLAREVPFTGHNGYDSAVCGRAIRKAWVTSTAQ